MDLVKQSTRTGGARGWANVFGRALLIALVIVAVVSAAVFATSLIGGSPARSNVGSQVDPLAQPALIAFRQSEHGVAGTRVDPLAQPALIAFRQSEHGVAGSR